MEWKVRSPPTSSLPIKNFQIQGLYPSQQFNASGGFSQANTSMQNPCTYFGSNQTINYQTHTNNIVGNTPFQCTGGSKTVKPIFPKELVSGNGPVPSQHVINVAPVSRSSINLQMTGGIDQNSNLMRNAHISSAGSTQSSTANPIQNVHQAANPYMVVDSNSNHTVQNSSNSTKTSVYQHADKNNPKSLPARMPYYYNNGPATSQTGATVPHNSASSHYLNSPQNLSCIVYLLAPNIQKQINGPNPNLPIAVQAQNYASDPPPYSVAAHHDSRNANQIIPQVTNTNCPSAYLVPPVQANHGQFLLSQPAANITSVSNENVQAYQSLVSEQITNLHSAQHGQKPQSAPIARETNEVGNTGVSITGQNAENPLSNKSANSFSEVGESSANSAQTAGTVLPDGASIPRTSRSLEQDNTGNGSENFPENVSKFKITRESLALDFKKLYEMKIAFLKLKEACSIKHKIYLSSVQKKQTPDTGQTPVHSQNPNASLPSLCNTSQSQPVPLLCDNQVFQVPSNDAKQKPSLSPISSGSNQIKDVPSSQMNDHHLLPILRSMLQGTVDEGMLSTTYAEKRPRHPNRYLDVQENSSNAPLVSGGSKSENHVNNSDKSSRLSPKAFPTYTIQEPLACTTSLKTNNQLEKGSTAPNGYFELNKAAVESFNKRLANEVFSSVQNATNGSSLLAKNVIQEGSKNVHSSGSTGPALIQQGKNPCLQKFEKNVTTAGCKNVPDTSGSTSLLSKTAVTVSESNTVEKPSITGNSCKEGRNCSLEELETSLALWRKCLPASLNGQLSGTMDSVVSLPSSNDKIDGKKQQTSENIPNMLIQNDQTKVITGSNETIQSSGPSSLGKNFDSNLLKASEPQIAIVTPLILAKESTQNEVQKNSPSLEIIYPVIEEGSLRSLEELISTVPDTNKEVCSPSDSCKYRKDVDKDQKRAKSTEGNGILKDERVINSCDLNQGTDSHFSSESEKLQSQLGSEDTFPPEMNANFAGPVPQKVVKSGLDLPGPCGIAEVAHNDTELQISSVCTLVQGDAFYNSQIANIFCIEPMESNIKNDTSSKECTPCLQHNKQQPGPLQSGSEITMSASEWNVLLPSPDSLTKAIAERIADFPDLEMAQSNKTDEMSVRNSEEEKSNNFPEHMLIPGKKLEQTMSYTKLGSDNEGLPSSKEDLINTSSASSMCIIRKESTLEQVPAEESAHSESSVGTPATLLDDQLTELSKEFPYGIGDLKALNELTSQHSVTKFTERDDKDHACAKKTDSSDTIDQIKIIILNSQQMKEVFPEHNQQSCNKTEIHEGDQLKKDPKETREHKSHIKTDQDMDVNNSNVSAETSVKKKHTYCCLRAWLASVYALEPCSCMLDKEAASNEKVDLYSESKTMFKDSSKASKTFKTEDTLNDPLQMTTLDLESNVALGDESNICKRTSGHKEYDFQANEYKPSKVDQEGVPLSFLEKLDSIKTERTDEQEMKELPLDTTSISVKTEPVDIHEETGMQEYFSRDQAQCPSCTEDVKMVIVSGNLDQMESSNKLRSPGLLKSKEDAHQHRIIDIKQSTNFEQYKITQDSSETQMIMGPTSRKCLKKQVAVKMEYDALDIQHTDAINSSNTSSIGLVSERRESTPLSSALQTQGDLSGKKLEKIKHLKEKYAYRKAEYNEPTSSEHIQDTSECTQKIPEHIQHSIKRINLEKYAYSKENKNVWKHRNPYLDNKKTTPPKQRELSNISKKISPAKEVGLDVHNRDKWSERSLSDKKACFTRKNSKLSISLQREQKKSYLNRVAFKRTAQKIIRLTSIESIHSKSVWHVKSSTVSECPEDQKKNSSSPPPPKAEKQQMLEFKTCPEILFRNSILEEQDTDAKLPEKGKTPITAVKSKREDWLNYIPIKRRKTVETEAQVDEDIPLGIEGFHIPVKDSNTTFQTYRKLHLEKSQSLDSSPVN
ncbi:retroelement silencing factor 1 isoform X2 [Varanus komodoensis]|uniref:Retroelement silencing factor 1 n=1 Tax=Varanus komodoensis TaxID=61221 RepID=A0A8D2Q589_VARKO|nr:retroelement silencing factor 1 isoform X2 [Varanus komodoensis]